VEADSNRLFHRQFREWTKMSCLVIEMSTLGRERLLLAGRASADRHVVASTRDDKKANGFCLRECALQA